MRLFLAPMEGVVDHHFRKIITPVADVDYCVTEFVRVNNSTLTPKVFLRSCPELNTESKTANGTPVRVQILGSNPDAMASSARLAAEIGAAGIDINFGCPARCANRSGGGSVLLKEPDRIHEIVKAVRNEVPDSTPVTVKIRLGYEERTGYLDTAKAAADAGADELFVHARSKTDGYRPPAYWECIAEIRHHVNLPIIANGEIWNVEDWKNCRAQSGADDFMIGRGIIATPDLAAQIRAEFNGEEYTPLTWADILPLVYTQYCLTRDAYGHKYLGNRVKQWLGYLRRTYRQADQLFLDMRRCKQEAEFEALFEREFAAACLPWLSEPMANHGTAARTA